MDNTAQTLRLLEAAVDKIFPDRWSPRAYCERPIAPAQIDSLFEAARWSPSCFNEQPWFFIYASDADDKKKFLSILNEKNQTWAYRAPLLIFALCKKDFSANNKPNRHAAFDTGAAWMALALQARALGLYAHAMAGFNKEKAYEILQIPQDTYDIMAAIAVGSKTDASILDDDLKALEAPNVRKPLKTICCKGAFPNALKAEKRL